MSNEYFRRLIAISLVVGLLILYWTLGWVMLETRDMKVLCSQDNKNARPIECGSDIDSANYNGFTGVKFLLAPFWTPFVSIGQSINK